MMTDSTLAVPPPHYLLLNPRHQDPQQVQSAHDITADKGLYVIRQPHLKQPAHWALRLIDLYRRPDLQAKAQQWRNDPLWPRETFCGWLATEASPQDMVSHLEAQLVQRTPDQRRMLLRYFDPRVLDQLEHILDDAQRRVLMGPVTHWTLLDSHRQDHTLVRPLLYVRSRGIDQAQWHTIENTDEVERIRQAWLNYIAPAELPNDHYAVIMAWLKRADQHELDDSTDRITFVLIGAQLHWRFDATPLLRQLINLHHTTGRSLTALLNATTPEEWHRVEQWTRREPYPNDNCT